MKTTEIGLPGHLLASLAILAAFATGCSPGDDVLATVGDRQLTVEQFMEAARRNPTQYPGPADSAKALLYEDLLRRTLLLEEAERGGVLSDSLVNRYREEVESEALRNALFERLVPRDVPVSEGEARQLYAWRDSATRLQLIYAVEKRQIDAALASLRRGEDFAVVADRVNLAGMMPPGGRLDFFAPGALVEPLDSILRDGRPGELIGPIEAPGEGWFIVKVLERRPNPRGPWEEQQFRLVQAIQQRKRRVLSLRAFEMLRDAYHVNVDSEGIEAMFRYYNRGLAGIERPYPPAPEEQARVLARYDGGPGRSGAYTFADALSEIDQTRDRPDPALLPSFRPWVESRVIQRVAVLEARRRRLHEEPELRRQMDERVNEYILDSAYEVLVTQKADAGPADVEAAYRRHAESFVRMPAATVQFLVLPDSAAALRIAELARRAPTLREAILHSSAGLPVREQVVRFPTTDPVWGPLEVRLREMAPGEFGEPTRTASGWMAFQLVSKQQFVEPYRNLPENVRLSLQEEAVEISRERRLDELTESLRRSLPVREYRERLRRIRWPVETSLPEGMVFPG